MMINLFKLDGYEVIVEPEALLLEPFKKIWDRNKENKFLAKQELSYVFFMGDPRSEYMYLTNEESRSQAIKTGISLPKNWKPDKVIKDAIEFYNSFIPTSAALVMDAREAIEELKKIIKETDWGAKDEDGKFINGVDALPKLLNQLPKLIIAYNEAEKTLYSDIQQGDGARGSQEVGLFENEED